MPHKPWKLLLSFWAMSLAWAITLAANSNAQETLQPYATPIRCAEYSQVDRGAVLGDRNQRKGSTGVHLDG
jgi:hypothetical protein